jgi:TetR/AcrR family transcriptional regulator, regulator of biofilm formation and stress response
MKKTAAKPAPRPRASAVERRRLIIQATLDVIASEGLRAVSHRAVAARAGVPLAATTYYFRDLEELLTEAFMHWSAEQRRHVQAFHSGALAMLEEARQHSDDAASLAARLAAAVAAYVRDQVSSQRGDRVLEYAFLHEAVRLPRLRAALQQQQRGYLDFLELFHKALGSDDRVIAAQISNSVLLGLEKSAVLSGQTDGIEAVLLRHLQDVLPAVPGAKKSR